MDVAPESQPQDLHTLFHTDSEDNLTHTYTWGKSSDHKKKNFVNTVCQFRANINDIAICTPRMDFFNSIYPER